MAHHQMRENRRSWLPVEVNMVFQFAHEGLLQTVVSRKGRFTAEVTRTSNRRPLLETCVNFRGTETNHKSGSAQLGVWLTFNPHAPPTPPGKT